MRTVGGCCVVEGWQFEHISQTIERNYSLLHLHGFNIVCVEKLK